LRFYSLENKKQSDLFNWLVANKQDSISIAVESAAREDSDSDLDSDSEKALAAAELK